MAHGEPIKKPKRKIKVVRYRRYIRMMVETATIHESDKYDEFMKVGHIVRENPRIKLVNPWWVKALYIGFFSICFGGLLWFYLIKLPGGP